MNTIKTLALILSSQMLITVAYWSPLVALETYRMHENIKALDVQHVVLDDHIETISTVVFVVCDADDVCHEVEMAELNEKGDVKS